MVPALRPRASGRDGEPAAGPVRRWRWGGGGGAGSWHKSSATQLAWGCVMLTRWRRKCVLGKGTGVLQGSAGLRIQCLASRERRAAKGTGGNEVQGRRSR